MVTTKTIIESVYFLLEKLGSTDKLKLVKLMFLADKYHLIKYGRTITNDDYWAMEHGPVGSNIKDVLEYDNDLALSKDELEYAKKYFVKDGKNKFKINPKTKSNILRFLSETDIEALNVIVNNFGKMTTWSLRNFTHKYPEWKQYEDLFFNKDTKRERIQSVEIISTIPEDNFGFTASDISHAKEMLNGIC